MLKNITEVLVRQKLDKMIEHEDCCKCQKCQEDIIAYALNRLPTKYVSTDDGELFARAGSLSSKYEFEIVRQLAIAMNLVKNNPRH